MDLGAGEGRVLASAMKFGAKSVVGYELPANSAHKFVYYAVFTASPGIFPRSNKSRYFPALGRLKCPDLASYRPLLCPDLQHFDLAWTE